MQWVSVSSELIAVGFGLVFVGVLIVILALVLAGTRSGRGKVKSAGLVIVGPVPIIFGSDKESVKTILILATTLTALLVVATTVYYFLFR